MGLGWARRIAGCWMRLCAARDPLRSKRGGTFGCNAGALAMHFAVAKTGLVALELQIVRCVLAPPERVCLEIMS
jgi:hypothetical protein